MISIGVSTMSIDVDVPPEADDKEECPIVSVVLITVVKGEGTEVVEGVVDVVLGGAVGVLKLERNTLRTMPIPIPMALPLFCGGTVVTGLRLGSFELRGALGEPFAVPMADELPTVTIQDNFKVDVTHMYIRRSYMFKPVSQNCY